MPSHDTASLRHQLRMAWGAAARPSGMIGDQPLHAAQREVISCLSLCAVAALRAAAAAQVARTGEQTWPRTRHG